MQKPTRRPGWATVNSSLCSGGHRHKPSRVRRVGNGAGTTALPYQIAPAAATAARGITPPAAGGAGGSLFRLRVFLPAPVAHAAVHRQDIGVAHLLEVVGGQRGAEAA